MFRMFTAWNYYQICSCSEMFQQRCLHCPPHTLSSILIWDILASTQSQLDPAMLYNTATSLYTESDYRPLGGEKQIAGVRDWIETITLPSYPNTLTLSGRCYFLAMFLMRFAIPQLRLVSIRHLINKSSYTALLILWCAFAASEAFKATRT